MKLSAAIIESNPINRTVNLATADQELAQTSAKTFWQSFVARFWGHTAEIGKLDTKSFEGLL